MVARGTSIRTYQEIRDRGLLSEKRLQIYSILFEKGPLTYNEIFKILQGYSPIASANIGARLNEMREMGCVVECGERICSVTGMNVILWDVTEKLPKDYQKPPTKTEQIRALCEQLGKMTEHLSSRGDDVPEKWKAWNTVSLAILKQCSKYCRNIGG